MMMQISSHELFLQVSGPAFYIFLNEGVDQVYGIEELDLFPMLNHGCSQSNGYVGFSGPGSTNKDEVMGGLGKLPGCQFVNERSKLTWFQHLKMTHPV